MRSRWSLALLLSIPILIPISMPALTAAAADKAPRERRLQPSKVEASTFLRTRDNAFMENYHPNYVADDDPTTYWAVGIEAEEPKPQWLRLHVGPLEGTSAVRLRIQNGVQKPAKEFKAHGRAKGVTVKLLPSGVTKTVELADARKWQEVRLEQSAGALEAVELEVASIYVPGVRHAATSVTEVQVFATSGKPARPAEENARREALKKWRAERLAPKKLPWTAVSAGNNFTCGIKSDGSLACWGSNEFGQLAVPDGNYRQVDAGDDYACAIRIDNTMACWGGDDGEGPALAPGETYSQVSVGYGRMCAIKLDGSALCWARPHNGVPEEHGVLTHLSAGGLHDCGLRPDGTLACWREGDIGKQPPPRGKFTTVSSGFWHACALNAEGNATCWISRRGPDGSGVTDRGQARHPSIELAAISAGAEHTCGLRAETGTVVCWGAGTEEFWPGTMHAVEDQSDYGQSFPPTGRFVLVSAGNYHTCALTSEGKVACWGAGTTMADYELGGSLELGQAMPP